MYTLIEKPLGDVNCTGLSEPTAPELFGVPSPKHVILPESDFVSSRLVLNITPGGLEVLANAFSCHSFCCARNSRILLLH